MRLKQPIWPRFLPTSVVLAIARIGPCGRMRRAPGTWGSLAGLVFQLVVFHELDWPWVLVLCTICLWISVAFCGEAEFRLGRRDPGEVVLDEFVAIPLCFLGWEHVAAAMPHWAEPWGVYLAAFALFRLFDITKPFGIKKLQDLPGGWGVTIDDTVAALLSCAVMHAAAWGWTWYASGGLSA